MSRVTISLDKNIISEALQRKFENVGDTKTMLAINNALARYCNPYVPYLNGPLSRTAVVSAEGVRYVQPYARYQYYGENFNHTTDVHPLASAKWDQAMLRDHGEEFNQEVKDTIIWRIKESGR